MSNFLSSKINYQAKFVKIKFVIFNTHPDNNTEQETGVVDPKRLVVQSVSGMVTHTSTCHVYKIHVCQMYATR